jgi:hypothetical protein
MVSRLILNQENMGSNPIRSTSLSVEEYHGGHSVLPG